MILSWLDRNGKLVFLSRTVRAFGYGFLSITLGIYLNLLGFSEVAIGFLLMAALANSIFFNLLASLYADRWGRRKTLAAFASLMALSGITFYLTDNYLAMILAAFIGTVNVTGTEASSFFSIEQAIVPQTCPPEKRNTAFGLYNTFGALAMALGVLVGGLPDLLQSAFRLCVVAAIKPLFLIYALIGLSTLMVFSALSKDVELNRVENAGSSSLSPESRRVITRLSALFGIDALAGGFVIQSIFSLWFFVKFGVQLSGISYIFAASALLQAFSYMAASRLANRFGLINTMVFTHIPSNIFLILVPVAPTLSLAIATLFARSSLSQMDVPTRQSYIVSIVKPEERTAAAGLTTIARNVTQSISPSFTGYLLQFVSLSAPFFLAGGLKVIYDLALYSSFRKLKTPEETHSPDVLR